MSRLVLWQGLLMNLDQKIKPGRREYLSRQAAYAQLKARTGQDFGYDSAKWRAWLEQQHLLQNSSDE